MKRQHLLCEYIGHGDDETVSAEGLSHHMNVSLQLHS